MKKSIALLTFLCFSQVFYAQGKFSAEIGGGLGFVFGGDRSFRNSPVEGRGEIFASIESRPKNSNFSIGISLAASSNIDLSFDSNKQNDELTVLNPFSIRAYLTLVKMDYNFDNLKFRPFISMGIGQNTFVRRFELLSNGNAQRVKANHFALAPRIGLNFNQIIVSAKYVWTGKTPQFEGQDFSGNNVILNSEQMGFLYLSISYKFNI